MATSDDIEARAHDGPPLPVGEQRRRWRRLAELLLGVEQEEVSALPTKTHEDLDQEEQDAQTPPSEVYQADL